MLFLLQRIMSESSPSDHRLAFRRRRRRKRPRPTTHTGEGKSRSPRARDNTAGRKETQDDIYPTKRTNDTVSQTLPLLLYRRETGLLRRGAELCQPGKRQIRFSQLRSSNAEAVLALEQSGSYFVSLAGSDTSSFTLALRLYSVPSLFMLEKAASASSVCPLVTTIPLPIPSDDDDSNEGASPVATIPVQVVVSRDWSVGVAFVHHSSSSSSSRPVQDEDALVGDAILFSFSASGDVVQSFTCSNVRVAGSQAYTMRNLLWETTTLPCGESTSTALCSNVLNLPGYLLLNDEEDGFRLTWVVLSEWNVFKESYREPLKPSNLPIMPSRRDIITKSDEVVWEEHWSDRYTGRSLPPCRDCQTLNIVFDAYFQVDALLYDILSRRREKFSYQDNVLPEFHYNLISIDDDGRTASLVIVFERGAQLGAAKRRLVAVFVDIDILTQDYQETSWLQNLAPPTAAATRAWSNALALSRRMKHQMVGPFCSTRGGKVLDSFDWSVFYVDTNNTYDPSHDTDVNLWERYVRKSTDKSAMGAAPSSREVPNPVSCMSLFPNCDLVTNDAVRLARPVPFIRCRNLTTEFVYG